ncbi:MAG TPA: hypothetical protein EYP08_06840 [Pyrodictiaceae archaeon]|nr:hypothetical protein [Pyrodictiaceae archaeon]HIQ55641.1 hypothetical protein [Pyrodictium sp.]
MRLLEAAVLVAIAKGIETLDELAELLRVDRDSIVKVLEQLEAKGLVKKERKGLIFKKTVYRLTQEGYEVLEEANRKLREAAKELEEVGKRLEKEHIEASKTAPLPREGLAELIAIAPLLSWLGLLDIALMPVLLSSLADHEEIDIDEESYDIYIE